MSSPSRWVPRPRKLAPEPGWAHIFRLQLDLPPGQLETLAGHLSADEHARAERFLRDVDQQRFIAARGQLRVILAAYLETHPAMLRFTYNDQGKPSLAEAEPPFKADLRFKAALRFKADLRFKAALRFNLSHSQGLGLLAVTFGQEVGVDVERLDREVDYANIARRFFAPSEVTEFFAFPPAERPRAFCTGWTRKEAYIKARGMGMAFALDGVEVSLDPHAPARLSAPAPGWSLHNLDPGEGFVAALVVEGEIQGLRCWDAAG